MKLFSNRKILFLLFSSKDKIKLRDTERALRDCESKLSKAEIGLESAAAEDKKKSEEIHLLRNALAQLGGSQTEMVASMKEGMRAKEENVRLAQEVAEAKRINQDLRETVEQLQRHRIEAQRLKKVLE